MAPGAFLCDQVRGFGGLLQDSQPNKSRVYNFVGKKVGTLAPGCIVVKGLGQGRASSFLLSPGSFLRYPQSRVSSLLWSSLAAHSIPHKVV